MCHFLLALPPKFEQIAVLIETLLDMETIMVDELIGCLKPSEEQINRIARKSVARLNLTEDELVLRMSSRLKVSSTGSADHSKEPPSTGNKCGHRCGKGRGSGGRGGNRGGGDSGGRGGEGADRGSGASGGEVTMDECCYCGKHGL
jgi:hypothetical protein